MRINSRMQKALIPAQFSYQATSIHAENRQQKSQPFRAGFFDLVEPGAPQLKM